MCMQLTRLKVRIYRGLVRSHPVYGDPPLDLHRGGPRTSRRTFSASLTMLYHVYELRILSVQEPA
jgi:hypothetical protein